MNDSPRIIAFNPKNNVILPGDLVALSHQYLAAIDIAGHAENTISAYRIDLEQFVGFCEAMGITLAQHVTGQTIDDFAAGLIKGNGVKPRTAARKLEVVRSLFTYGLKRDIPGMHGNPVDKGTPIKFHAPKVIAPDEGPILDMINNIPTDTVVGIRDKAIYYLMYCAGLRDGGIRCLQVYDPANPAQHTVTPGGIVRYLAKGGRTKETVADQMALELISAWLEARQAWPKARNNSTLFVTNRGTPMSNAVLIAQIKLHAARVGIKHMTPHLLRHRRLGVVTEIMGLKAAQDIAGHEDIRTTGNIYGGIAAERLRHRVLTEVPVGATIKDTDAAA